ncbi:MAG: Hsp20/alpha crystallin family protein [Flavobacteriaceae bacterium]|nr:Hsp20/alpha crystallin family protein [Flavobacteriaceae bacterium]
MKTVKRNNFWFPSVLDDFFPENKLDSLNYETFSIPKVNIKENLSSFVIDLAVPGQKKKDFSIELENNVLTVSSSFSPKRETTDTENEEKYTRKEFNYGSFTRSFTLPEEVNTENIEASYTDGVLSITVPKTELKEDIKRMVEIS